MKLEIKRGKSKICIKICNLFAYMKKKQYLCGGFFFHTNTGERTPIKQSSAGGLFLDSSHEHLQRWCYHLGGKIARLLFLVTKYF